MQQLNQSHASRPARMGTRAQFAAATGAFLGLGEGLLALLWGEVSLPRALLCALGVSVVFFALAIGASFEAEEKPASVRRLVRWAILSFAGLSFCLVPAVRDVLCSVSMFQPTRNLLVSLLLIDLLRLAAHVRFGQTSAVGDMASP